ncbi:MAG: SDR family NAD(P)-dependent oxidoreductase [Candidatus Lambdaproteobacteria bacterium]|nr:SDR family NAD(P)-dependent oxidoreductase [Candidatus Lambdaproteobacteria bacterium]
MVGMDRWKGKVALVTGASSGIGRATAVMLAKEGMKVAVCARRAERLQQLKKELEAGGAKVLVIPTDLQKEADIHDMWKSVRKEWGGVDVLINNAGLGWGGALVRRTDAEFRQMLEVNVLALTICIREAILDMANRDEGYIINISSMGAHSMRPGNKNVFYGGTKHAVKAITEGVRSELVERQSKTKIGMISPGIVATEIAEVGSRGRTSAAARAGTPLESDDIADIIRFMLSAHPRVQIHDVLVRPSSG